MEKYLVPKKKAEGEVEYGAQQKKKQRKEEIVDIPLKDNGLIKWDPKFLSTQEADALYKHLEETLNWTQPTLNMYGKTIPRPRLQSWMADKGVNASLYQKQPSHPWTKPVLELRERLEQLLNRKFDYVLVNKYRDGKDSIAPHADNEAVSKSTNIVASISLGQARRFILQHMSDKSEKMEFNLTHGSLIVMLEDTQKHWKHSIPKQPSIINPRINLTFRTA